MATQAQVPNGCPECAALGETPRRIWGENHYDAQGQHHAHNLETGTAEMHCSNGHTWFVHMRDHCSSCGPKAEAK